MKIEEEERIRRRRREDEEWQMKMELHRQQLRMTPQASQPAPPAAGARIDPPAHGHKASGLTFESAKSHLPAWAVKSLRA